MATKTEKPKLKTYEEMTDAEKKEFSALSESKQIEYNAKLQMQEAREKMEEARQMEADAKEMRKKKRELDKGVKEIVKDLRGGLIETGNIAARLTALGVETADIEAKQKGIEEAVKNAQNRLYPAKPAYELTHSFALVGKDKIVKPTDGSRPDVTLQNLFRKYGCIQPLLVKARTYGENDNLTDYVIIDGRRRYWLFEDGENVPCVIVTGFPDEITELKGELVVNRGRSLNQLSTAQALIKLQTAGETDSQLRKDIGFRTGEIEKITALLTKLIKPLQTLLFDGNIAASIAIQAAKLPKDLQEKINKDYEARKKESGAARVTETDLIEARASRAKAAVLRDSPLLGDLADSVPNLNSEGEEIESVKPENATVIGEPAKNQKPIDNGGAEDVKTDTKAVGEQPEKSTAKKPKETPKTAPKGKVKGKPAPEAEKADESGVAWQETAFIALEGLRTQLNPNAPVWDAFKGLVQSVAKTSETIFVAEPEIVPDPKQKAAKGWAAKALKSLEDVYNAFGTNAPDACFTAYDELEKVLKTEAK